MIVTLTPNPSIDATLHLGSALQPGAVNRAQTTSQCAGGKGINVSHAAYLAGRSTLAVFPASPGDPFITLVNEIGLDTHAVPMAGQVRVNTTITEDTGVTTKVNGPGPALNAETLDALTSILRASLPSAAWIVLAGSLPQGVSSHWYSDIITALRQDNPEVTIAVDTSDAPLMALGEHLDTAAPDLIKPNGLELGQLTGVDGLALEKQAEAGDFSGVIAAARTINRRGVRMVLVTLGAAGAVLVTEDGAWKATPPAIEVQSTVGAGDSSLAGFIIGLDRGMAWEDSLALAVAYGSAAASLPGTRIPSPELADVHGVAVEPISPAGT